MQAYKTVRTAASDSFIEKKSKFIGHICPVTTQEEAMNFIAEKKSAYWDATHNVYAYVLRDGQTRRYSDDGEPQGTAGQPMLNVFQREGVSNVCCVVTRYFGGILLGAGGLTRAYSKSARDALTEAGVATMCLWEQVCLECAYSLLERVKLEIAAVNGTLDDISYAAHVTVTASLPDNGLLFLRQRLTELSAGSITLHSLGQSYRPGPREEL